MAGLGGTGRLADDLYLMAHHDVSGRPYLQPREAGLGFLIVVAVGLVIYYVFLARRGRESKNAAPVLAEARVTPPG